MTVIEFKNVSKHFKIYQNRSYSIKEKVINKVLRRNKLEIEKFDVLKDASFKIEKGETIGIIGENGTGKSTTLKIISKILYPDSGEVTVSGKVSALLEVGAGFQPDLTGRENVYLYGSILGLSKAEIDKKYEEIIEFAEVQQFMDTAVKNYSSGMYMRLAFSIAISVDPDILVIDEVLAVGDEAFQKKCINKILSFKKQGKTIVFVSHDMSSVRRICDRVFFIKRGGHMIEGSPEQMIGLYLKLVYSNDADKKEIEAAITSSKEVQIDNYDYDLDLHKAKEYVEDKTSRRGNNSLQITKLYFSNNIGHVKNTFETDEDIKVNIEFKKNNEIGSAILGFAIYSEEGWNLVGHNCSLDGAIITNIKERNYVSFTIKNNIFLKGKYYLTVALHDETWTIQYDYREKNYFFNIVESGAEHYGKVRVECKWDFSNMEE